MKKTAVILFNLGGPDSPEAVKPFLFNLFNDPAIIGLPQPFRFLLAKLIAGKRAPVAQEIYNKIGGKSPILENTQAQALALERVLGNAKCFIAMRYWHPFIEETARQVKEYAPDEIILLPLYPQFSTTTTGSSFKEWERTAKKSGITAPTKTICCYPQETGFITSLAATTKAAYEKASAQGRPRILFSAHGLPEKIVKAGDPYQFQCELTVRALLDELEIPDVDYALCYQSRVGPLKWIGPATDDEIKRAGRDKKSVVIVPIAFVSEHSETLVEIDIEYRHLAEKSGVPSFAYVPTVGIAPEFIEGLAGLVRKVLVDKRDCVSAEGGRICPQEFTGCCMNKI